MRVRFRIAKAIEANLNGTFEQWKEYGDQSNSGHVAPFKLARVEGAPGWMQLAIGIGIGCGYDESNYLYAWNGTSWIRRLDSEQSDYAEDRYKPQYYVQVAMSQPDSDGNRLLLTTGVSPSCASVWQTLYYRIFRVGATAGILVDNLSEWMNIDREIDSRIEPDGALIEFQTLSKDSGVWARTQVLHFKVAGTTVRRVEPIALDPQDFVDEWLNDSWSEIKEWSIPKLEKLHDELHDAKVDGGFQLVQRCTENPNQWQVAFDFEDETDYFLVEQSGEHSFQMIDVTDEQSPGCPGDGKPRSVGDSYPTLFPTARKP